jgi:imidazolonepropionase
VDHLEIMTPEDIEALKTWKRCLSPYLLLFLKYSIYPSPQMIAAGLPLALATDYNGSTHLET